MVINSLTLSSAWTWLRIQGAYWFMYGAQTYELFVLIKVDPTILMNDPLRSSSYVRISLKKGEKLKNC